MLAHDLGVERGRFVSGVIHSTVAGRGGQQQYLTLLPGSEGRRVIVVEDGNRIAIDKIRIVLAYEDARPDVLDPASSRAEYEHSMNVAQRNKQVSGSERTRLHRGWKRLNVVEVQRIALV